MPNEPSLAMLDGAAQEEQIKSNDYIDHIYKDAIDHLALSDLSTANLNPLDPLLAEHECKAASLREANEVVRAHWDKVRKICSDVARSAEKKGEGNKPKSPEEVAEELTAQELISRYVAFP